VTSSAEASQAKVATKEPLKKLSSFEALESMLDSFDLFYETMKNELVKEVSA
jgi:hypothetical protein